MVLEAQRLQPDAVKYSFETSVASMDLDQQTVTVSHPNGSEEVGAWRHCYRMYLGVAVPVLACASVPAVQRINPT